MLVQKHIEQLIRLSAPHLYTNAPTIEAADQMSKEHARLLSQIVPVKFGNTARWAAATTYDLASIQIPRNAEWLCLMRVECYTVNLTAGASDYGVYQPVPPGKAYWQETPAGTGTVRILTDENMQSHVMCDVDEMRFFSAGRTISLIGNFNVSPDGSTRDVRTTCYAYNIGSEIIERLGGLAIYEPPSTGV